MTYGISSIEKQYDWTKNPVETIKYRCIWIITEDKNIADMVWKNVKDYEGAEYRQSEK